MLRFVSALSLCGLLGACASGLPEPPPIVKTSIAGGATFALNWQGRDVSAKLVGTTAPGWRRSFERNGRVAIEAATNCAVASIQIDLEAASLDATVDCSRPATLWI